jgi:raffinose/stachyose/melibiose transport system substrate-binding protein
MQGSYHININKKTFFRRRIMKKKVTSLLLAMGMLVSLVGCGKADDSKKTDVAATPTKAAVADAADPTAAPVASEPVDLTMWCIATESDSNRHAYEASIADFEAAHPEINFTWEPTQNQEYKTKLKAAVAADELPDIFYTWGAAFLGDFVDAGRVYSVDDVYATYATELPEVMMSNVKFDGKYYGAPMTMNIVAMFANMDILKQAGFDKVPATYEELIACCDALVAKGLIPFG